MRILLLGASGFIGRELFASLVARGHEVIPAVHDRSRIPPFSRENAIVVDLNRDTTVEAWMPRLAGVDAVVNCAGILEQSRGQSIEAIHHTGPAALFEACERTGVRRSSANTERWSPTRSSSGCTSSAPPRSSAWASAPRSIFWS